MRWATRATVSGTRTSLMRKQEALMQWVARARPGDDQRLLERGLFVYDALYAWCQRRTTPDAG
jgi:hypothetical protein